MLVPTGVADVCRAQLLEFGFDIADVTDLTGLLDGLGLGLVVGFRTA